MCFGKNLPNSSCHFLQILHQYSVPSNITPLYVFSSNILYPGEKKLIKVQIFKIFECSGENLPKSSCHFPNHKEVFHQILHDSPVSWKITPQYLFRSKIFYFAQKGPIKMQILETFEALIKIQEVLVNFETTNWFLFKFCINL